MNKRCAHLIAVLAVSCGFAFGQDFRVQVIEGGFTWQEAKADAETRGGHLAVLNTQDKIDAVKTYLDSLSTQQIGEAWIGLTNNHLDTGSIRNRPNEYLWVTGEGLTASNWHSNAPNNAGGNGGGGATAAKLMRWGGGSVYGWDDDFINLRRNYLLQIQGTSFAAYDAMIESSGFTARKTTVATFDGSNIEAFDFGAISGDATFEFIMSGDPTAGGRNGYIGRADANPANSLRYEQWDDTGQLGFTRAGVADNTFTAPKAASPSDETHVTYRWTQATSTMDLFINGAATDSIVGAVFEMPTGPGHLGNVTAGGNEGLIGTIARVTTFNSALSDSDISSHSNAWSGLNNSDNGLRLSQIPGGGYARLEQEISIELGKRYKTIIEIDGEYEKRSTDLLPHLCPGCFEFNFDSYTVDFDGSITTIEGVFISDKNGRYDLSMALWSVPQLKFRKVELIDLTTQQNLISNSNFAEGLQGWKANGGTIELYDLDGPVTYTLSEAASPNGSVTGYGKFESGSEVTLTATPNLGYRFTGWTGSANGSQNPLSVTMNQDLTVGASFTQDTRDTDGDGLTNYQELIAYNSNPNSSDSDNDGILDDVEIDAGLDINTPESIANAVAFLVAERNKRPTAEAYNSVIVERDARPTQLAYDTVIKERDERPTFEQLTDSRLGSVILVADAETNKVKLRFCIEESDQLGQWVTREEEAEVDIPLVPEKKFFRFSVKKD